MVNATTIVRIADRFLGRKSKNSIARSGFLQPIIIVVSIFYVCLFAYFVHLEHKLERNRKTVISNLLVQFIAPPPPKIVEPEKIETGAAAGLPGKPKLGAPPLQTNVPKKVPAIAVLPKPVVIKSIAMPAPPKINPVKPSITEHPIIPPKEVTKTTAAVSSPTPPALVTAPAATGTGPVTTDQGKPSGVGTGNGTANGTGTQPGGGGDGNNSTGTAVGTLAMGVPHVGAAATAMGNIAPYRKDMLMRLAENWHPKKLRGNIVVVITLSAAGQLINSEIQNSSGDEKLDQYAIDTINKTAFAPLPSWFTGSQLRLKVELARVEALKRGI